MGLVIRQASLGELEELVEWRMEVLRHVFCIPETEGLERLARANREYYQEAIPSGGHIAVFAELDGAVAGCGGLCLQREMPSPDNPDGKCVYLMNIYTREAYRRNGVGRAVVCFLARRAREWGAGKIYLETSESGRALYERLGFREMRGYMRL